MLEFVPHSNLALGPSEATSYAMLSYYFEVLP